MSPALTLAIVGLAAYAIGSIPFAYTIVRGVTGEDITAHGTGNIGAMNVRRTTGSWAWFLVAMSADIIKGIVPVLLAVRFSHAIGGAASLDMAVRQVALAGAVVGHNYSIWMAIKRHTFIRTGKGLATGAGALLAYDWRYAVAVVVIGLAVIAITKYMMAGQVAAALSLPLVAIALRSPDWPFALLMGLVVYIAHHKRFLGLLAGEEPKLYISDKMGPRG